MIRARHGESRRVGSSTSTAGGLAVRLYTDGAARGNPGPASIGVALLDPKGKVLREIGERLGRTTNNVAEYRALLRGLEEARALGADEIHVFMDSELVVRQILGEYRVKNETLQPLAAEAQARLRAFRTFTISHIPREQNKRADRLANRALNIA